MKNKVITLAQAVDMIKPGQTIMIAGFLANGSPAKFIDALVERNTGELTLICNDTAYYDKGVGKLIANKQVKKVITSHIGTNPVTIEMMNNKAIEVEFVPQGTLAERIRSGGAGLGGVLTQTGLGTLIAEGKPIVNVDGKDYILEKPLKADIAIVGPTVSDKFGNLTYIGTSRNFNTVMATAGNIVIAEPEQLVDAGEIIPENVHTPGIFIDYIIA